jgi:hypothetical protein
MLNNWLQRLPRHNFEELQQQPASSYGLTAATAYIFSVKAKMQLETYPLQVIP